MTTYNVLNQGSREILNLDGPLSRTDAEKLAESMERDHDVETELQAAQEEAEHVTRISIYRDNVWAGDGLINSKGQIVDCAAVLGPDQDASDETYEAIEDAMESLSEITRPDGVYSWGITETTSD